MNNYEEIVCSIVNSFNNFYINVENETLVDALEEALPEGTSIVSTVNTWDNDFIYGTISISLVCAEDEAATINTINHEHFIINWSLEWEYFYDHIQYLTEGWTISW